MSSSTRSCIAFYDRVFADPRLAPFFHRVTKDRAIQKQYSFLADLFSGTRNFFGLRPFNAHHWMVISDELFDYREALMDEILVEVGLAEPFRRRWASLHELFRREIVKSSPRGLIVDGVEQELKPPEEIPIDCSAVCDGCFTEMPAGSTGYFHAQGGEIFCARCSATPAHQMA